METSVLVRARGPSSSAIARSFTFRSAARSSRREPLTRRPRPMTAFLRRLGLLAAVPFRLSAPVDALQQQPAPAATPQQSAAAVPVQPTRPVNAEETREQLKKVMQQYPPSLREVLQNDPSLLSNSDYLATYPALAAFIAS